MKKVSIITVTYNCEKTIVDTIKSVNSQTCRPDIEYIVIDGHSTDSTLQLIQENQSTIDQWISEKDSGIYDAMNKGLSLATGEWVGFLHADDLFYDENVISTLIEQSKQTNYNCAYGNLNYIQERAPYKVVRYWESQKFTSNLLKNGWMPPHPTVYIKKELINKIGFFNTAFKISADYDYMLRLFSNSSTESLYINKTLVNMRLGGVSNNSLKNIIRKSKEDYKALSTNNIGGLFALFIKNISKLTQFISK